MKNWLINFIGGPLGAPVRGIVSAIVGVLVGMLYAQAWVLAYKVPFMATFSKMVVAAMDPSVLQALSPTAIGAATAAAFWGGISGWLINHLKGGIKVIQQTVRDNPAVPDVKVDGLATSTGETAQAVQLLSRKAYEAIYPDDTHDRGGDGMPEIRKPLPNA